MRKSYKFIISSRPSFFEGMGRVLDLGGVMNSGDKRTRVLTREGEFFFTIKERLNDKLELKNDMLNSIHKEDCKCQTKILKAS